MNAIYRGDNSIYFQIFFIFYRNLEKMIQFDEHIFSDGLIQPPTRKNNL